MTKVDFTSPEMVEYKLTDHGALTRERLAAFAVGCHLSPSIGERLQAVTGRKVADKTPYLESVRLVAAHWERIPELSGIGIEAS